ncbi:MAG: twin-arginine translocase subunit TatC [Alphaproteobacteria bacterium]|nr:twin-arginine translocase subunit TatC [Alphaproteobacteria bacterium]
MSVKSGPPAPDPVDDYRMSILDHLRELRKRLVVSLWAAGIGIVICFVFAQDLFDWLVQPMNLALQARGEGTMAITDPLEGVMTYLKVAVLAGLFTASPVIFYQAWLFVGPGLYQQEKRLVLPLVLTSTTLFMAGAAFGYFVIFQYGFSFFLSVVDPAETAAVLSINAYLLTATKLLVAFGASFQLPVVVFFLARIGLIDAQDMVGQFRYAIVAIFVVAAIITPPDPLTQVLMAGPLTLLYGVSIGVAWLFSTKERLPELTSEDP